MLLSVLGLGLLVGMQHAFEADHMAAVSSIVSRRHGLRRISWHGAVWGLGHTLTLLLVAGTCILMKAAISEPVAERLELAVGVMLVLLGGHVLWRLWRERVHIGLHAHADGTTHVHAHSHKHDRVVHRHSDHEHEHQHETGMPWRTLLVGTVHGMAGSAALVVLAASQIDSPWWGMVYVLLFGLGSLIGMALLTAAIALPLTYTARTLSFGNHALQAVIGLATIGIGGHIVLEAGRGVLGLG